MPKLTVKLGNKETKEDSLVTKEKSTVEKIKLLYKGERKRPNKVEKMGTIQRKRAKFDDIVSEGGAEIEIGQQDYPKTADVSLMLEPGNKTSSNEVNVSSFKVVNLWTYGPRFSRSKFLLFYYCRKGLLSFIIY